MEKLSHENLHIRLQQLIDKHSLQQADTYRLKLLKHLFVNQSDVPLLKACNEIFSDRSDEKSQADFRKFRNRVKKAAENAGISIELGVENPKAGVDERRLVVLGEVSPKDKLFRELNQSELSKDLEKNKDYAPPKFENPSLSFPMKPVIYSKTINDFFTKQHKEEWQKLSKESRIFLTNLSVKLEPIIKIFPVEPESITMGFEILGISGDGLSFYKVMEKCGELDIPPELPRLIFFLISLNISQDLSRWWLKDGITGAKSLIFTTNLDNVLISSNSLFRDIVNRFSFPEPPSVLLEVNEELDDNKIGRVKELCETYKFKIALDDSAEMSNKVRRDLKNYAEIVKISHTTSRQLLNSRANAPASDTIDELAKYRQEGKPFIIEGLEDKEWIDFLKNNWKKEYGELYIQGYEVRCGSQFTEYLAPPEKTGLKGAYIVCKTSDPKKKITEHMDRKVSGELLKDKYAEDRYITPTIKTDAGDKDAIGFLEKWQLADSQFPFLALLGNVGMGKTFLCRMFTRYLLNEIKQGKTSSPVPLYLNLANLSLSNEMPMPPLEKMIESILESQGIFDINGKEVLDLVHSGEVLLIIDSIDEKAVGFTPDRALHFWQQIRRSVTVIDVKETKIGVAGKGASVTFKNTPGVVWKEGYFQPDSGTIFKGKVLLACRTHYFRDLEDVDSQLTGARKAGFRREDFQLTFLNTFTEKQIISYLEKCFGERGKELWDGLKGIYNIPDLAKRPFLLSLIQENISEILALKENGKNITSASLYELAAREWIKRDDMRHKIPGNIKAECMENLALEFWKMGKQSEHIDWLDNWVQQNILPRFPGISLDGLEQFKNDMRTATFLSWSEVEGEDGKGLFRFQHRSFQEFFIARKIARSISDGNIGPLKIPKISMETSEFVLGLLHGGGFGKYNKTATGMAIKDVLEKTYIREASENALRILLRWKELYKNSAPVLEKLCLSNASLDGFVFKSMKLNNSLFDNASLDGAKFMDCDLSNASFAGTVMKGAKFMDSSLIEAILDKSYSPGVLWKNVKAGRASFKEADITGAKILDSDFSGSDFSSSHMKFATFTRTNLERSIFNGAIQEHTGFALCNLKGPSISKCQLKESVIIETESRQLATGMDSLVPRMLTGHGSSVYSVAVSSKAGIIISGSWDKTIKIWDIKAGELRHTLKGHEDYVSSVAVSSKAGIIISGSHDKTIKIWDIATGELRNTLKGHGFSVTSVAVSSKAGIIISGSDDKTIKIWDIKTGGLRHTLKGHEDSVSSVAVSSKAGIIISGSDDKTIKIWDIATGGLRHTLKGHEESVSSVAVSNKAGIIISGSRDKTIKIWDIKTGGLRHTLKGHEDSVSSMAVSSKAGIIISGSDDKTIKIWDFKTGELRSTLKGHEESVSSVAVSSKAGIIISGSRDITIKIWDFKTGELRQTLKWHYCFEYSVGVSNKAGIIISSLSENTIKICDIKTGELRHTLKGHEDFVTSVAVSSKAGIIISGSGDKTIKVWDFKTGELRHTLKGHEDPVRSVAVSSQAGIIVSGSDDNTIKIWDIKTGGLKHTLKGHEDSVSSVAVSGKAGIIISSLYDKTIKIWDIKTGGLKHTLKGHEDPVRSVAVSSQAGIIISGSWDKTIKIWDIKTGGLRNTLKGHENVINSVAVSDKAGIIISGSDDKTIKIWDIKTGELRHTLKGHEDSVTSVAVSGKAGIIISGSNDKTIKIWNINKKGDVGKNKTESMTINILPEGEWAVVKDNKLTAGNANKYAALGINLTNFPCSLVLDKPGEKQLDI